MDKLRSEGFYFAGRQAVHEGFSPRLPSAEALGAAQTLKALHETVVLLPSGEAFVRPLSTQKSPITRSKPARKPPAQSRRSLVVFGKDDRQRIANTLEYPYSALLYAIYIDKDGSSYSCSGGLVDKNLYVTAAHCVYDSETRQWPKNITLYYGPGKGTGGRNYRGAVNVTRIQVLSGYTPTGDMAYDFALLTLAEDIGVTKGLGHLGVKYDCPSTSVSLRTAGFPIDKPEWTMWTSSCKVSFSKPGESCDAEALPNWEHECDTFSGDSGSAMWDSQNNLRAVHVAGIDGWSNLATPIRKEMYDMIMSAAASSTKKTPSPNALSRETLGTKAPPPKAAAPRTPTPKSPAPKSPARKSPTPKSPRPRTPAPKPLTTETAGKKSPAPKSPTRKSPAPRTPSLRRPSPRKPSPRRPSPRRL